MPYAESAMTALHNLRYQIAKIYKLLSKRQLREEKIPKPHIIK